MTALPATQPPLPSAHAPAPAPARVVLEELADYAWYRWALDAERGTLDVNAAQRQCAVRFLDDLEQAADDWCLFVPEYAEQKIAFIATLRHWKGEFSGRPFELEPWEAFIVANIFGWVKLEREDLDPADPASYVRRFRTALVLVPRKNGKSPLAGAVAAAMLLDDDEPGAEVYSAATTRDQAGIVWKHGRNMLRRSGHIQQVLQYQAHLAVEETDSVFKPLASREDSLDGLDAHCVCLDEVHQVTQELYDVLDTAMAARRQPLMFMTSTAGADTSSFLYGFYTYAKSVVSGEARDDTLFAFIAEAEPEDDWQDPAVWRRCNPNLGITVKVDDMQRLARKAQRLPSARNAFRRLRLDQWVSASGSAIDMIAWDACGADYSPVDFDGLDLCAGLDLSSVNDITALVLNFHDVEEDIVWLWPYLFVPQATVHRRTKEDRIPYASWVETGALLTTPGRSIDQRAVVAQALECRDNFGLNRLFYDPWNAVETVKALDAEGFEMIEHRQGPRSMSEPSKMLERRMIAGTLRHPRNPALTWMLGNLVWQEDPHLNIGPSKKASKDKIDGAVAAIMTMTGIIAGPAETGNYEQDIQAALAKQGTDIDWRTVL